MVESKNWTSPLLALTGAMLLLFVAAGCDDDVIDGDGLDTGLEDVSDEGDGGQDINGEEISCTPGAIVECVGEEQSGIEICNAEGDGLEASSCPGVAVCRDAQCVQVNCTPGSGRCVGDQPQICEPDGEGDYEYADQEACGDGETCEAGVCLDRCGLAELTDSYIGCEYWAVETDNYLIHTDPDFSPGVDPDHRPPFAIVLANTEGDVTAEITVEGPGGGLAESIPAREVHSRQFNPALEWETVYSQTVDEDGNRIGGPHSGPIDGIELPPGATLTLLLPNQTIPFGETTVTSTAYRVTSSQPVVAYQFNPFCCNYNYSNDASLLLPTSALTENYMMIGPGVWVHTSTGTAPNPRGPTLSVAAMEDDTNVEIQLRAWPPEVNLQRPCEVETVNQQESCMLFPSREGDGISGPDAQGRLTVTLDRHEVLNVAAGGAKPVVDLTGARVTADKPVAAFGAHTCTNVPFTRAACDHVESQLFPLETWATSFVVAPHKLRNPDAGSTSREGTYWKFVAREDGTRIEAGISIADGDVLAPSSEGAARCSTFSDDPSSGVFELNAGQHCEFGTRELFSVQSSQPIAIAGFMSGQNTVFDQVNWGDHAGDPSMFMVPPRDQFRLSYTFLTPPTYHVSYITVLMMPGFNVTLDGESVDPMEHDYQMLADGSMLMAHIEVEPGPHQISAVVPFGLIVYGFDNYVSYSYTGGLDLTKLNPLD